MDQSEGEMAANAERISPEELSHQIQALQREPFRDLLATMLECEPTKEALQEFANKSPDRWWQSVTMAMKSSGYQEKTVHEHNFNVRIQNMSDAELLEQNKQLQNELDEEKILDAEIVDSV